MARLIDAEWLLRLVCGRKCGCNPDMCGCEDYHECEIGAYIKESPTVDAVEVVRGEWILIGSGRITKSRDLKCSVCGNYFRVYDDVTLNAGRGDANFCPSCGAKMDKEAQT